MAKRNGSKGKKVNSFELKRQQILRKRRRKFNLKGFTRTEKPFSRRVCEFMEWAATKYPKQVFLYEEVAQAIFELGTLPRRSSPSVMTVRNAIARARVVMLSQYNRDIISEVGVGVRATTDSADAISRSVTQATIQHERSLRNLRAKAALVDSKEMAALIAEAPEDIRADLETSHEWFQEHLQKYLRRLEKPEQVKALLPPPPVQ